LVGSAEKTAAEAIIERGGGGSQVAYVASWLQQETLEAHPESVFLPSSRTISSLFSVGTFSKWPFPDGPLAEVANWAAQGNGEAVTAIKIVKNAARLAGK
jgi:hypothetical protein